jgi:hypothetical protein
VRRDGNPPRGSAMMGAKARQDGRQYEWESR